MDPHSRHAEEIFDRALDFEPAERPVYLAGACGNDVNLRRRVEDLLLAHDAKSGFLPCEATPARRPGAESAGPFPHTVDLPMTETVGTVIGRYKLLEKLGEGGFGAVWVAEQKEPVKRRVAIKFIKLGIDTQQVVARFEAERQALALMDHPNIAKVLDAGATESGRPYFVMELVKGVSITKYCDDNKLTTRQRLGLFMSVCQAVQHAHQKGIIHRDIKPSNIMITLHDGVPVPKVIDFGIAKATQHELTEKTIYTQYGQMIGTPSYMSPEQAEMSGLDVDTRSDIYSLGVLLYELLTGTTPLEAERLRTAGYGEMLRMIQEEEPAKPSTRLSTLGERLTVVCAHRKTDAKRLRQSIRGELDWIVMKALEKHRQRRYETANGLARDIQRCLDDEPVVAGPPSSWYRLQKLARRNRVAFTATAVVFVALTAGLGAAIWGLSKAQMERDEARSQRRIADQQRNAADEAKREADEVRQDANRRAIELERRVYLMHLATANRFLLDDDYHRARVELGFCPEAPRGWEWSFTKRRIDTIVPLTLSGAEDPIYTSDGKRLIAIGVPGSPQANKVRIWDTSSGELLGEFHHESRPHNIALSADETLLAGGAADGSLNLWNFRTKQALWTVKAGEARFGGLAIGPKNSIAAATWDGQLRVFEPSRGDLKFSLSFQNRNLRKVMFSPDGRWIAAGSPHVLVDATTGQIAAEFRQGGKEATFNPDGRRIAAGNGNEIVIWNWDGEKLTSEKSWKVDGVKTFWDFSFASDGAHLVSDADAGLVQVWDVATGKELAAIGGVQIYWLATHPTENQVAFCSSNGRIRLWNYLGQDDGITQIQAADRAKFSPDGKLIALSTGAQVSIHDAVSGKLQTTIEGTMRGDPWMPDSSQIVVSNESKNTLEIRNVKTGQLVGSFPRKTDQQLWSYVRPDGRHITTISQDRFVRTWDVHSETSSEFRVERGGWMPDSPPVMSGQRVAIGLENSIEIWDTETRSKTHTLPMPGRRFFIMEFSHDGQHLFVGSDGGMLTMHDLDSPKQQVQFTGHTRIARLTLSPDGTQLFASDYDKRAIVWDVESRQPLITLAGNALHWSPDNRRIAIGTPDGLQIWTLPR